MAIGIAGRPSTTPTIGRVAYTLDQHLYLADWDGSRSEVVSIPGVDAGATLDGLAWARSGRAIAVGVTASDGRSSIVILDPEGSVIGRIELGRTDEATPLLFRWSPADDVLAVAIDAAGSVMISTYEADGTLITTDIDLPRGLTFRPWGSLDWAPSGDRIVVTGCVGCDDTSDDDLDLTSGEGSGSSRRMAADGRRTARRLSASSLRAPYEAVWSPTGDRIAFDGGCVRYDQDCATSGIWTMRSDGSGLMTVTSVSGLLLPAIWSPDGAHLVLLDHAGCMDFIQVSACPSPHDSHLTIVDVPSGAVTRLNEGRGQDSPVAWPGDGSLIMFDRHAADTATGDDVPEVWAIRAGRHGPCPTPRSRHHGRGLAMASAGHTRSDDHRRCARSDTVGAWERRGQTGERSPKIRPSPSGGSPCSTSAGAGAAEAPHPVSRARRRALRRGALRRGGLLGRDSPAVPPDAADADAPDREGARRRTIEAADDGAASPSPDQHRRRARCGRRGRRPGPALLQQRRASSALSAPRRHAGDHFYRNGEADEMLYVHEGHGTLDTRLRADASMARATTSSSRSAPPGASTRTRVSATHALARVPVAHRAAQALSQRVRPAARARAVLRARHPRAGRDAAARRDRRLRGRGQAAWPVTAYHYASTPSTWSAGTATSTR